MISSNQKINIKEAVIRSRNIAKRLSNGIEYLFTKNKIDLIYGYAKINKQKEIVINQNDNEQKLVAKNIIIATGAGPKKIKFSQSHKDLETLGLF